MKSSVNSKIIILISLGILFAFSLIIITNLSFFMANISKSSDYRENSNLGNKNLQITAFSGKIHIDNNWTAAKSAGVCTGKGTYLEPYVIENLEINGGGSGSCILIENSDVYFRIENCYLYNSIERKNAGIKLNNINNSQLIDNICSSNCNGIYIYNGENNTVSGNTVSSNLYDNLYGISLSSSCNNTITGNTLHNNNKGIYLTESNYNIVSGNNANYNCYYGITLSSSHNNIVLENAASNNEICGIYLRNSNHNTVSGNTANNNHDGIELSHSNNNIVSKNTANNNDNDKDNDNYTCGISLNFSDNNTISGNTLLGNYKCIIEYDCEGNIFKNNDCGIISGFNLFFLLGTLLVAVIFLSKKLKKS